MGQALPKPALRPFLAADTPVLAAIFVASVEELTGDDYSEAQQQAWASAADDEEQFGKRLASELTLIATLQNSPVGFASLKGTGHIDMLYVHPAATRQGVAALQFNEGGCVGKAGMRIVHAKRNYRTGHPGIRAGGAIAAGRSPGSRALDSVGD